MKRAFQILLTVVLLVGILAPSMVMAGAEGQSKSAGELYSELSVIKAEQGEDAANRHFAKLSSSDQATITEFVQNTTVTEEASSDITAMASGCWMRSQAIRATSAITGSVFWRLEQTVYWCGNGSRITYFSCSATISTPGFGWGGSFITYCGSVYGGSGHYAFRYFSQAKMTACWSGGWCPTNNTPRVYQQGDANGGYAGWRQI